MMVQNGGGDSSFLGHNVRENNPFRFHTCRTPISTVLAKELRYEPYFLLAIVIFIVYIFRGKFANARLANKWFVAAVISPNKPNRSLLSSGTKRICPYYPSNSPNRPTMASPLMDTPTFSTFPPAVAASPPFTSSLPSCRVMTSFRPSSSSSGSTCTI